jgi:hypothetical protein
MFLLSTRYLWGLLFLGVLFAVPFVSMAVETNVGTEAFPIEEGMVAPVLIASTDLLSIGRE